MFATCMKAFLVCNVVAASQSKRHEISSKDYKITQDAAQCKSQFIINEKKDQLQDVKSSQYEKSMNFKALSKWL